MRVGLSVCCLISVCFGCSAPPPRSGAAGARGLVRTNATSLTVAPTTVINGKVVHVNTGGQFVVLTFPLGQVPRPEKRLSVYRNGLKVGELRVSKEQRDQNTVADIVAGEAQVGDEVRDN